MTEGENLQVEADSGCFVCGLDNPAGLQIQLKVDSQNSSASSQLSLDARFQGWQGVIHGGILATLLDEVAIYACRGQGEQFVTTGINVRYRKPVPVDCAIDLSAKVVEVRRKIYKVESRIEISGVLYAAAEVQVMCLDGSHRVDSYK
ncbi:MAG: PaaI family thioesterase [Geopsychrobacter sp.]|nr:PaaI family thioesterase [Geopsychrobacter sp.]